MDKETCFTIPKDVTHGRGYVYSLQYHIVWCTKYRKRILASGLDEEVKAHLWITAENLQAKILAMEVMPDHVHLLLDIDPTIGVNMVVSRIKGKTSNVLNREFPELRRKLPTLWTRSKFIATVGSVSLDMVKQYIEDQKGK